jgi:ankyrin repeat protein
MIDWKTRQMIKASGWPLSPDLLAPGADFNAPVEGGLVPLHWACQQGKDGLVRYMIEHGANVQDQTGSGQGMLELAARSRSFQTVMMLIEQLKSVAAPLPDDSLKQLLTQTFSEGHPNSRNRLQQTLKDWDRIRKKSSPPGSA